MNYFDCLYYIAFTEFTFFLTFWFSVVLFDPWRCRKYKDEVEAKFEMVAERLMLIYRVDLEYRRQKTESDNEFVKHVVGGIIVVSAAGLFFVGGPFAATVPLAVATAYYNFNS